MFKQMRRKDREITDRSEIMKVIKECEIVRYGLKDGDGIYIVPMHYGIGGTEEAPVLYSHCAAEGHKIDLIRESDYAAFEIDGNIELQTADVACGYSSTYSSVIGEGRISLAEDNEEKMQALQALMEHYTGESNWEIPEQMLGRISIIRLEITDMTCKANEG